MPSAFKIVHAFRKQLERVKKVMNQGKPRVCRLVYCGNPECVIAIF
jgi:hypothetical protein